MKVIITKCDNGYTVKCGKTTHNCKDFLELVRHLEQKFKDKIADIEWPESPKENPSKPWIPFSEPCTWPPEDHNCSKCGLKLESVMHYFCSNFPCPAGLGGVMCNFKTP